MAYAHKRQTMFAKVGKFFSAVIVAAVVAPLCPAYAKDIAGSRDHALVSRYAGSDIIRYAARSFDEYPLLIRKATRYGGMAKNLDAAQKLEGKVTEITYRAPAQRTTLEVFRNYEDALKRAGFELLFACSNEACGGRNFNHAVVAYTTEFAENYPDQRYLAARLKRDQGHVYIALYTVRQTSSGGPTHNRVFTQLDIIEARPMQTAMVTVNAKALAKGIDTSGHVAIYGILFDTGSAKIKPASHSTLKEIAKLFKSRPNLKLLVVGHTDNVGGLKYNMELSKQRAVAVVQSLVSTYRIDRTRLTAAGIGFLAPVASNKAEAGRAKNRRVELVER